MEESNNKDARTRLLEAGASLFAEKGFTGTSVREICELAGTGNNMIHHYFGNKQGLYDTLISHFTAEIFTVPIRIMQKMPGSQAEFASRFEMFIEETLEAMIANQQLFVLVLREEVLPAKEPFAEYISSFIAFVEHGKEQGFVNEAIDPAMLTGLVLDRLGNQVQYASKIRQTSGADVITDADYKARWLRANLDLLLHGFLA